MITRNDILDHPHQKGIIVCPEEQWIWLKPCRVAGSSMRNVIFKEKDVVCRKGAHGTAGQWQAWLRNITDGELAKYWSWTFARDPIDRLLSAIQYFHFPLDAYLRQPEKFETRAFRIHTMPQEWYTVHADWIGRYEAIDYDWHNLCEKLELPRKPLGKCNSTQHKRADELSAEQVSALTKLITMKSTEANYARCRPQSTG